jgi:hypothetical protein
MIARLRGEVVSCRRSSMAVCMGARRPCTKRHASIMHLTSQSSTQATVSLTSIVECTTKSGAEPYCSNTCSIMQLPRRLICK